MPLSTGCPGLTDGKEPGIECLRVVRCTRCAFRVIVSAGPGVLLAAHDPPPTTNDVPDSGTIPTNSPVPQQW